MIESLRVENFKSLRDVEVEFGKFTVLVGENNSGKSALMQSLMYLQEAEAAVSASRVGDPGYVDYPFHNTNKLFFKSEDTQADSVCVVPEFDVSGFQKYNRIKQTIRESENIALPNVPSSIKTGARLYVHDWMPIYQMETEGEAIELVQIGEEMGRRRGDSMFEINIPVHPNSGRAMKERGVFHLHEFSDPAFKQWVEDIQSLAIQKLSDIYYISDKRNIDKWSDDPEETDFVGHHGEDTVSMLHALRDDSEVFDRINNAICEISPDIAELRADMYGSDTETELADEDTGELINIVASGAGLRRLLPIIVQISAANEGDTVMIEEPEISVYPKTQERLVEFMLDSVRERDIQIILSTHGIPFTWKVQNMADPELGHALHFEKSQGETNVDKSELDRIPVEEYYGEI